jgi:predicted TIM-barrel fold metal-dependent hydrolase
MPLVTHFGAGNADVDYTGVDGLCIQHFETTVLHGKRLLPWLIYSGVFARHPDIKVAITEIPGYWWSQLLDDMDSIWRIKHPVFSRDGREKPPLHQICPEAPSEYCTRNVFVGASFMSRLEAEAASREGYFGNMMWGSDYPHPEGTFFYPESWDEKPMTHTALSYVYHGLPADQVRAMLGGTAVKVFGLDGSALETLAQRINAPSITELNEPVEVPDTALSLAFRQRGMFD